MRLHMYSTIVAWAWQFEAALMIQELLEEKYKGLNPQALFFHFIQFRKPT